MFLHDKERLIVSIVIAAGIHGILIAGSFFVDWGEAEPFEYTGPVYVELQEQDIPEPPPEEPEPEPEAEPEPEPAETVETELKDPEPSDAGERRGETAAETDSAPADAAPPPEPEAEPEPEPPPEEPEPAAEEELINPKDFASLKSEAEDALREAQERIEPDEPDSTISELDLSAEDLSFLKDQLEKLEDWVNSNVVEDKDNDRSADDEGPSGDGGEEDGALDPGKLAQLDKALSQLNPTKKNTLRTDGPGSEPGRTEDGDDASPPEGADVPMVGDGRWRTGGEDPDIRAEDFEGNQPPLVSVIVAFKVDENGIIVRRSLKIEKSSGYTTVDQKISEAVNGWTFMRDEGAQPVKGEMTFIIRKFNL